MVIDKQQIEIVAPKVPQGVSGLVVSTLGRFVFGLESDRFNLSLSSVMGVSPIGRRKGSISYHSMGIFFLYKKVR